MPPPAILYLHGLASSPQSTKAQYFARRLDARGYRVTVPDLNQPSFFGLTPTRARAQAAAIVDRTPGDVIVFGSSFGGRVAAQVAQARPARIIGLVLMAPAFEFRANWVRNLGARALADWEQRGQILLDHPAYGRAMPLGATFLADASQNDGVPDLPAHLPALVFHGRGDDVIQIDGSRRFAAANPSARLVELDADHQLSGQEAVMWPHVWAFIAAL